MNKYEGNIFNGIAYQHIVETHEKRAKKEIVKENADRMTANGADPEVAKVLAKIFYEYDI